jgi:glycogen operon protein
MKSGSGAWETREGLPYPLGVSWCEDEHAYNFALSSRHATSVRLLLFAASDLTTPRLVRILDPLVNKSGRVWHCRLDAAVVGDCRHYAYQVDGSDVHCDKLLFDPYARAIDVPPGFERVAALGESANFGKAPLGVIVEPSSQVLAADRHRPHHHADTVIYELHVRGFTQSPTSGVSRDARGTFAGIVEKIPYLRELGVTVLELMPVFQSDPQERDRWGYMPLSFFAPNAAYAPDGVSAIDAFVDMVHALHDADIEVVIDVVYSHTAESGGGGPVYSLKGLDNSSYYLMSNGWYAGYSGCGNSINANDRYVRKMIHDSMRYWTRDMHVDGFRFDLASELSRGPDGALNLADPAIFGDIASDPLFDGIRMIAEPWDAAGAYELGRAFPGITWAQWNGRFRDDVRRFVRGDAGMTASLIQRVYGSDDLFPDQWTDCYHPYQSVNYVTCHDGFTLYDLVSYARKHNAHGADDNLSSNHGHEGDDEVPDHVLELRLRQAKNFIALLMLSNGTPMLRAGDELLHTQQGHNNPYDRDDELTWLDWTNRSGRVGFWRFVQQMIAFRKEHPSLARSRFWREDVHWFSAEGALELASPAVAWYLRGASQGDQDLYVMVNASREPVPYRVQAPAGDWHVAIDTSRAAPDDIELERPRPHRAPTYVVSRQTVVVLVRAGRTG